MAIHTTRSATAQEVLKLLNDQSVFVYERLGLSIEQVQLSMPQDDKEPRIRVSLRPGSKVRVPSHLIFSVDIFSVDGGSVQVPLETAYDYQPYTALSQR